MLIAGKVTTNQPVEGIEVKDYITFTYPNSNPATFEGNEQPTNPPIELQSVEFRYTDDSKAVIDSEDTTIKWFHHFHGTSDEPTADYDSQAGQWIGREDKVYLPKRDLKDALYLQVRSWGRNGLCSDWSNVLTLVDDPPAIPAPEITSIKTNAKNQVRIDWTDEASNINNFSHYEIMKEEIDTTAREETSAVIVGEKD